MHVGLDNLYGGGTHAPLTLPGTRSTAVQIVQSNMHRKLRCRPDTGKREAHFRSSGVAPGIEQFARFAFGDVEMRPLRQPAGYSIFLPFAPARPQASGKKSG